MSEWLRRQTWNLLGFARAGSNPAVDGFIIYFSFSLLNLNITNNSPAQVRTLLLTVSLYFLFFFSLLNLNITNNSPAQVRTLLSTVLLYFLYFFSLLNLIITNNTYIYIYIYSICLLSSPAMSVSLSSDLRRRVWCPSSLPLPILFFLARWGGGVCGRQGQVKWCLRWSCGANLLATRHIRSCLGHVPSFLVGLYKIPHSLFLILPNNYISFPTPNLIFIIYITIFLIFLSVTFLGAFWFVI